MPNEVMRSRTVSIPRQICERGDGSRERKHRMQEQHQPKGRYKLCIARPVSSPTHPGAPCSRLTHIEARARAGSRHTHSRRAFGSSLPHTGRTYLRKPLAARASHTLGTPSAAASTHLTPLSSSLTHTSARYPWQPMEQPAGVHSGWQPAGTRSDARSRHARARARARTFMHRQPSHQSFYPARPLNVFCFLDANGRAGIFPTTALSSRFALT